MSATPEARSLVLREDRAALTEEPAHERALAAAEVSGDPPVLRLDALRVRPDRRGRGLGHTVLALLRAWALEQGATVLTAEVPQESGAMVALARGTKVLGTYMTRPADAAVAVPAGFGWRAMTAEEFGPWQERQVQAYAEDNLASSGGDVAHALERSRADFALLLPAGVDTPDTTLVRLVAGGEPVGHLWLRHHRPGAETFGFDLEIVPDRRREGWGRAAVALAGKLALEAGDAVLGLHVFGENDGARALYESVGFQVRTTKHDLLARS